VRSAPPVTVVAPGELARQVESLGRAHGLDAVGIAAAAPLTRARQALVERKAAGLHGGMEFTYRNPARSTSPDRIVPGAASIVVGARRYASDLPAPPRDAQLVGRVARYAWTDHYAPLREALHVVARHLRAHGHRAVVVADDNAMVDREVAYRAGIGWFGKNANLLLPDRTGEGATGPGPAGRGAGSWFVLGAVVTDASLPPTGDPVPDGCGACRRCIDACPTGAIVAPGVVDARRCLAWLVQQAGTFPREHRVALHERLYGCDDCQEVCPPNIRFDRTHLRFDQTRPAQERGSRQADPQGALPAAVADAAAADGGAPAGAATTADPAGADTADAIDGRPGSPGAWVPLLDLLAADDEALLARYGRWYLAGRDPRWLRRNALLALGNVADARDGRVVATLDRHLRHADPLLRSHAVWAARRLGRGDLLEAVAGDDAPEVVEELAAPPPPVRVTA
jgi:epoxyqueuosine reductase